MAGARRVSGVVCRWLLGDLLKVAALFRHLLVPISSPVFSLALPNRSSNKP